MQSSGSYEGWHLIWFATSRNSLSECHLQPSFTWHNNFRVGCLFTQHPWSEFKTFPNNGGTHDARYLSCLKMSSWQTVEENAFLICLQINHRSLSFFASDVCERFARIFAYDGSETRCCAWGANHQEKYSRRMLFAFALKDFPFRSALSPQRLYFDLR